MQLSKQVMLVEQAPSHTSATDLRRKHVKIQEKRDLYHRWGELKHDIADVDRQLAVKNSARSFSLFALLEMARFLT